jgi:hypothetical protein
MNLRRFPRTFWAALYLLPIPAGALLVCNRFVGNGAATEERAV